MFVLRTRMMGDPRMGTSQWMAVSQGGGGVCLSRNPPSTSHGSAMTRDSRDELAVLDENCMKEHTI